MASNTESKVMAAPIELLTEFIDALMAGNYKEAQILCKRILEAEPDNQTCKEFADLLNHVILQEEERDPEEEDSDSYSSESCGSTENGDSNREYSSNEEELNDVVDEVELNPEEIKHLNLLVGGYPLK